MKEFRIESSYKDPSGFVFLKDGEIHRQINPCYYEFYDYFMNSGLYKGLTEREYLVAHEEVGKGKEFIHIRPRQLPLITYPYEWSFSHLKMATIW